jgi:hypothetical protein
MDTAISPRLQQLQVEEIRRNFVMQFRDRPHVLILQSTVFQLFLIIRKATRKAMLNQEINSLDVKHLFHSVIITPFATQFSLLKI